MRGMKAFEARPKRQNYRDGGPVRGPGTGTSDEVPDKVPEGTFIMPTDSTRAIGEQALAGMGGGARGMGPVTGEAAKIPVNLSNGEFKLPPEQVHAVGVQALEQMKGATHNPAAGQARGMKPELFFADGGVVDDEQKRLQNQTAMYVQGAQASAAARPPQAAPAAAAPAANPLDGGAVFGMFPQLAGGKRTSYATDTSLRTGVQATGPNTFTPAAPTEKTIIGGGDGMRMNAAQDERSLARGGMTAVAAPVASIPPATPIAAQPGTPAANAQSNAQPGAQAPAPGGALPSPQAATGQVAPGVYQHGRGQYSDQASGMGMPAVFTGQPNAQNLQAAQALSDQGGLESRARVQQQIDAERTAKQNDPRQILLSQLQGKRLNKNGAGFLAQLAGADAQERTSGLNYAASQDANRLRNQIDSRRLGMEEVAAGYKSREADRQEKLYERYQTAKPEDRSAIAQQIRDLQGKTENAKDNVITLGGGQEWDATAGTMRNVPQRAVDLRTGREIGGRPAAASTQALAVGSTSTVNGKTAVWDGSKWNPR